MDSECAKNLVALLSDKWDIPYRTIIYEIINKLNNATQKIYSGKKKSIFEFSFISVQKNIRILHRLKACNSKTHYLIDDVSTDKMIKVALGLMNFLNIELKTKFNLDLIQPILSLSHGTPWTGGFGMQMDKDGYLKIKNYMFLPMLRYDNSAIKQINKKIRHICYWLKLEEGKIRDQFMNDYYYDTIGIDFLPSGDSTLKIYTYHNNLEWEKFINVYTAYNRGYNSRQKISDWFIGMGSRFDADGLGLTYRIGPNSSVNSIKAWFHFLNRDRVHPDVLYKTWMKSRPIKYAPMDRWLRQIAGYIKECNCNLNYLALEAEKMGFYFA